MSTSRRERGQATPLWAVVLLLAGLLLIPSARLIRVVVERAEARSAADAAALAAAIVGPEVGRSEAVSVAEANGAAVVDYQGEANRVTVTVQVGDVRATASAEREVVRVPPGRGP